MSCWGMFSRKAALFALLLPGLAAPCAAKVFVTVDEALKLAFPGGQVERRAAFLTAAQVKRARALAGAEVPGALVSYYVAARGGQPAGTAYFDTHRVRTLPETLMIVVDPQGKVGRIEVISFREPEEYRPRGAWYQQFLGRGLDADLQIKRGIHPVTGATLTARATTDAVRRVLALHQVILGSGENRP